MVTHGFSDKWIVFGETDYNNSTSEGHANFPRGTKKVKKSNNILYYTLHRQTQN